MNIQIAGVKLKNADNGYKCHPYIVVKRDTPEFKPNSSEKDATSVGEIKKALISTYLHNSGSDLKI